MGVPSHSDSRLLLEFVRSLAPSAQSHETCVGQTRFLDAGSSACRAPGALGRGRGREREGERGESLREHIPKYTQRLQNPLIEEYTFNHIRVPIIS